MIEACFAVGANIEREREACRALRKRRASGVLHGAVKEGVAVREIDTDGATVPRG